MPIGWVGGKLMVMKQTHCYICGAVVPDIEGPTSDHTYIPQSPGCWKLYTEVLGREYGEWRYPAIHRLTVDCYAAQHPTREPDSKSAQSVQAHLLGIFLALETNEPPQLITKKIGEVVIKNKNKFVWYEPPENLGGITIAEVWRAKSLPEHEALVYAWAQAVWQAWEKHQPDIKNLLA